MKLFAPEGAIVTGNHLNGGQYPVFIQGTAGDLASACIVKDNVSANSSAGSFCYFENVGTVNRKTMLEDDNLYNCNTNYVAKYVDGYPEAAINTRSGGLTKMGAAASGVDTEFLRFTREGDGLRYQSIWAKANSGTGSTLTFRVHDGDVAGTSQTNVLRLAGSGNAGLGADPTAAKLTIAAGLTTEDGEVLRFNRSEDALRYNSIRSESNSGTDSTMTFWVHDGVSDTSQTNVLRLAGTGNIGLGTAHTGAKLSMASGTSGESVEMIRFNRTEDEFRYNSIFSTSEAATLAKITFAIHSGDTSTSQTNALVLWGDGSATLGGELRAGGTGASEFDGGILTDYLYSTNQVDASILNVRTRATFVNATPGLPAVFDAGGNLTNAPNANYYTGYLTNFVPGIVTNRLYYHFGMVTNVEAIAW